MHSHPAGVRISGVVVTGYDLITIQKALFGSILDDDSIDQPHRRAKTTKTYIGKIFDPIDINASVVGFVLGFCQKHGIQPFSLFSKPPKIKTSERIPSKHRMSSMRVTSLWGIAAYIREIYYAAISRRLDCAS